VVKKGVEGVGVVQKSVVAATDVPSGVEKQVEKEVGTSQEGVGVVQKGVVAATDVPSGPGAELPARWREGMLVVTSEAATRADDAEVPIYLWNDRLMEDLGLDGRCTDKQFKALEVIRRGVLCHWRYHVT